MCAIRRKSIFPVHAYYGKNSSSSSKSIVNAVNAPLVSLQSKSSKNTNNAKSEVRFKQLIRDLMVIYSPSTVAKRLARHFAFGRSRVLTPVWVFFRGFPTPSHRGMSTVTYHLPSAPILTVPIPNLPVSVAEKTLENLSSPPPPFGGE
ncbi:hypothetical protein GEV33_011564 [Tenebrio molitor]|uniref:Uncharacterized protein n=1 Tax=Tenebrio molitor TaxID=7067 RepID=A0A8J6HB93_TENMO|nr:hypothetical protein GEV33_011564 [Tenebrio molitor]